MGNKAVVKKIFNQIDEYQNYINTYSLNQLLAKPSEEEWSMGQMYLHLIDGTLNFHLMQLQSCLDSVENTSKGKNFKGFIAFRLLKSFPPIRIKVPPTEHYTPKQPQSQEEISDGFIRLKAELVRSEELMEKAEVSGKTEHPGFSFLDAGEWLRLIEMHFRHHLKQRERLQNFLSHA